jgi:hypothetical protein
MRCLFSHLNNPTPPKAVSIPPPNTARLPLVAATTQVMIAAQIVDQNAIETPNDAVDNAGKFAPAEFSARLPL